MTSIEKTTEKVVDGKTIYNTTIRLTECSSKQFGVIFRALMMYHFLLEANPELLNIPGDTEIEQDAIKIILKSMYPHEIKNGYKELIDNFIIPSIELVKDKNGYPYLFIKHQETNKNESQQLLGKFIGDAIKNGIVLTEVDTVLPKNNFTRYSIKVKK